MARLVFAGAPSQAQAPALTIEQKLEAITGINCDMLYEVGSRLSQVLRDTLGLPEYDWQQVYRRFQVGLKDMLAEQRERTKVRVLADQQSGHKVLTDEQLEVEIQRLTMETIRSMPLDQLILELERKGVKMPAERER